MLQRNKLAISLANEALLVFNALPTGKCMRQGAAVDIFQLTPTGYTMRNPRDIFDHTFCHLADVMRGSFTFYCGGHRQDQFIDIATL
jgi:hypothetical protein